MSNALEKSKKEKKTELGEDNMFRIKLFGKMINQKDDSSSNSVDSSSNDSSSPSSPKTSSLVSVKSEK